jgi:alpha-tubulin suppressor-like RCC1 family protein
MRGPRWLALTIAALACQGGDTQMSCSPTPSCSLRDERFGPPPEEDAGQPSCREKGEHCHTEQVAAGRSHTCAVARAGELYCFGDSSEGQLGVPKEPDGGMSDDADDFVELDDAVEQVAAGGAHTCALTAHDGVVCFGRNADGEVDGAASPPREPVVVPLEHATQVAAGAAHSCAVTDGGVTCWGSARYGQVGRVVSETPQPPLLVPGTAGAVEVTAGARHSCARLETGSVLCWGELIDESGAPQLMAEPQAIPDLDDAIQLSAGAGHTCALLADGRVACFGHNESGQLGDGTRSSRARPVVVENLERSLYVSAGGTELDGSLVAHTCVQTKGFFVSCWGRNAEGQLGIGHADDSLRPQVVLGEPGEEDDEPFLPDVSALASGGLHTCAVDHDGAVRCFGDDAFGQLGLEEKQNAVFGRAVEGRSFGGRSRPDGG